MRICTRMCVCVCVYVYLTWTALLTGLAVTVSRFGDTAVTISDSLLLMASDSFIWIVTYSYGTWHVHLWHDSCRWDVTHWSSTLLSPSSDSLLQLGHDSFMLQNIYRWMWQIHQWRCCHYIRFPPVHETWLIHLWHHVFIWDVTYSYGTWLVYMGCHSFM